MANRCQMDRLSPESTAGFLRQLSGWLDLSRVSQVAFVCFQVLLLVGQQLLLV